MHTGLGTGLDTGVTQWPCELLDGGGEFDLLENVPYGEQPQQRMDALIPEGEGPFPALILIHGGGWHAGYKESLRPMAQRYAAAGIASFSIDYFLSSPDEHAWPKNVQDVACAVRQIKAHAEEMNLDVDRMALGGTSAGGHLAALAGLMGPLNTVLDRECGEADFDHRVAVVVDYFGATDLTLMGETGEGERPQAAMMLGASLEEDVDLWNLASPVHHVSEDDPAVVIAHGTEDIAVPIEHSEALYERLQGAGVESWLVRVEGAEHSFHGQDVYNDQARCVIDPVLRHYLVDGGE